MLQPDSVRNIWTYLVSKYRIFGFSTRAVALRYFAIAKPITREGRSFRLTSIVRLGKFQQSRSSRDHTGASSLLAVTLHEDSAGADNIARGRRFRDVSIAFDNSRMSGDRKRLVKSASPRNPGVVNAHNAPIDRLTSLISSYPRVSISKIDEVDASIWRFEENLHAILSI